MVDASAFQFLIMIVTGWLARREREVVAYLIDRMIPLGERHFRRAITEFVEHYHLERNHQVGMSGRTVPHLADALITQHARSNSAVLPGASAGARGRPRRPRASP